MVLIAPAEVLSPPPLSTLEVSIVQNSESVIVDGVVSTDDVEFRFAGELFGGVLATFAYDGFGLVEMVVIVRARLIEISFSCA
jgi:hypothetical protein